MKSNLVIIPSGPNALFQDWSEYSEYDFDLAIIQWTDKELKNTEQAAYHEKIVGQKWKLINEFSKRHDLSNYEFIWCLDDDCATTPELIQLTFEFCRDNNLDLAQPSLEPSSYYSHPPTLMIPGARMHLCNTVEIMCPIFSKRVWQECIAPTENMPVGIGYGFEGYWEGILDSAEGVTKYGGLVAMIDELPIIHTKPVTNGSEYTKSGLHPDLDGYFFKNLGYEWSFKTIQIIWRKDD